MAWFQGRIEFSPRALGNRSSLADPRSSATREILNVKVKHRGTFRPFTPSVLAKRAGEWFKLGKASPSYDFMLFACQAVTRRGETITSVPGITGLFSVGPTLALALRRVEGGLCT